MDDRSADRLCGSRNEGDGTLAVEGGTGKAEGTGQSAIRLLTDFDEACRFGVIVHELNFGDVVRFDRGDGASVQEIGCAFAGNILNARYRVIRLVLFLDLHIAYRHGQFDAGARCHGDVPAVTSYGEAEERSGWGLRAKF